MKTSFADILGKLDSEKEKKLAAKVPEWAWLNLTVPSSINLEQCSSSATAAYKARVMGRVESVADLTGGLGVDCWAFSKIARKVLYVERDCALAEAVRSNYGILGVGNVEIRNAETNAGFVSSMGTWDWIYLDPARRDGEGRKVFLIEECTPDITTLLPLLFRHSGKIMVKLSPMADITMVKRRLGESLKEIHVVGHDGECKELLCILERDYAGDCETIVPDISGKCAPLRFYHDSEHETKYAGRVGEYVFEPSAALMKAGCFGLACRQFGMEKLSHDSAIFTSDKPLESAGHLFKTFKVLRNLPLSKDNIKAVGMEYPRAEVSVRGLRMTSEELKAKLKCETGSSIHIFGISGPDGKTLLVTERIYSGL